MGSINPLDFHNRLDFHSDELIIKHFCESRISEEVILEGIGARLECLSSDRQEASKQGKSRFTLVHWASARKSLEKCISPIIVVREDSI